MLESIASVGKELSCEGLQVKGRSPACSEVLSPLEEQVALCTTVSSFCLSICADALVVDL